MTDTTHPPYSQVSPGMARPSIPSAAPAAGQAGLAKLEVHTSTSISDIEWMMEERFYRAADVEALITPLAAPVAAATEQASIDTPELRELIGDVYRAGLYNESIEKSESALIRHIVAQSEVDLSGITKWGAGMIAVGWREDKELYVKVSDLAAAPLATPADAGAGQKPTGGEDHPALIKIMDDILTPSGWEKYRADEEIALYPEHFRDIFKAGQKAARLSTPGAPVAATNELSDLDLLRRAATEAADYLESVAKKTSKSNVWETCTAIAADLRAALAGQSPAPVTAEPVTGLQADIDSIADEMEAEALNYEGDFADTVKGCVEALRDIAATPAPADRDAIRAEALEEVMSETLRLINDAETDPSHEAPILLDFVRAKLKSMERAADAKGEQQ